VIEAMIVRSCVFEPRTSNVSFEALAGKDPGGPVLTGP